MADATVKARPALLRALGKDDPPESVRIDERDYARIDVFKHDSWAATARYAGPGGEVVCKFNRVQPVLGLPMAWLGRRLADREMFALRRLEGVAGIPAACGPVMAQGRVLPNAAAHDFVPGHPLGAGERPGDRFFPALVELLGILHSRGMAYVDLHKRENVLVGDDGMPHLIDFQVCFGLWQPRHQGSRTCRNILAALQEADRYHLAKHVKNHRPDQAHLLDALGGGERPGWIGWHRTLAVPLRAMRRKLLTLLGVRGKSGMASSEAFPEDAVRRDRAA